MSERKRPRLLLPLAGILLLVAAGFALQRFGVFGPDAGIQFTGPAADEPQSRVPSSPPRIYYGPANSVAVLPFTDRSPAGEQAALSRGLAGEIQARLEGVEALQVTATRSSFFFSDPDVPRRIVAERLQAAFLLDGEWRAENDLVELTASLYDARRDREVWRRNFEGAPDRAGELGEAVARAVLDSMPGAATLPAETAPPVDARAWAALQRARYRVDPLVAPDLQAAQALLREALELDPGYDAARLALAELLLHPSLAAGDRGAAVAEARDRIREVLDRDSAAPADRAQAWGLRTHLLHDEDWRWREAAEAANHALELRPGDAGLLALASLARFTLGDLAQAAEWLSAAIDRDPLNLGIRLRLGLVQEFDGRYDEALSSYRQLLVLREDYPGAHAYRARVKLLQGKAESALREAAQEREPFWRRYAEILALIAAGRRREADPQLDRMIGEDGEVAAFQIAEILAFAGEVDAAFDWLERAREQRDDGVSAVLANPLLRALQENGRWKGLLQSLGLPAETDSSAAR